MAKTGYVIVRSQNTTNQYFTASSSYDKPKWTQLDEATIYSAPELAQSAVTKLFKYGSFSAKIVPLSELSLEFEPTIGDVEKIDLDSTENSGSDIDLGDDEDDMVADDQEPVCDVCDHEPCTCPEDDIDGDGIEDVVDVPDDADTPIETLSIDGQEVPVKTESVSEHSAEYYQGVEYARTAKSPSPDDNPHEIGTVEYNDWDRGCEVGSGNKGYKKFSEGEETLKINDPAMVVDKDKDAGVDVSSANEEKIKVPASVMTSLKTTLTKFNNCSDYTKTHDDVRSSFCLTVAAATQTLIDDLEAGDVEGLKMAQVHLTSFMSPIVSQFSPTVIKFIQSGGAKTSLKTLYDDKWATARNQNGVL